MKLELEEHDPDIGIVDRPLYSKQDRTLHLDPSDGDSMQSIQRELPVILQHDLTFQVSNGEYSGEGPAVHLGPCWVKGEAHLMILGNIGNRDMVQVDAGINGTFFGKPEHTEIAGMTLNGLTQFNGSAWVRDCRITGQGNTAISGKGGMIAYYQCDIGSQQVDYAAYPNMIHRLYIRGGTLRGSEQAIYGPMGAMTTVQWTDLGEDTPRATSAHRRLKSGVYVGERRLAFDD